MMLTEKLWILMRIYKLFNRSFSPIYYYSLIFCLLQISIGLSVFGFVANKYKQITICSLSTICNIRSGIWWVITKVILNYLPLSNLVDLKNCIIIFIAFTGTKSVNTKFTLFGEATFHQSTFSFNLVNGGLFIEWIKGVWWMSHPQNRYKGSFSLNRHVHRILVKHSADCGHFDEKVHQWNAAPMKSHFNTSQTLFTRKKVQEHELSLPSSLIVVHWHSTPPWSNIQGKIIVRVDSGATRNSGMLQTCLQI